MIMKVKLRCHAQSLAWGVGQMKVFVYLQGKVSNATKM